MCGDNIFQIKMKSTDKKQFNELKGKLKKIGKVGNERARGEFSHVTDFGYCINFENKLTIFNDGRALVKAKDEKEAKSLYSRLVGN